MFCPHHLSVGPTVSRERYIRYHPTTCYSLSRSINKALRRVSAAYDFGLTVLFWIRLPGDPKITIPPSVGYQEATSTYVQRPQDVNSYGINPVIANHAVTATQTDTIRPVLEEIRTTRANIVHLDRGVGAADGCDEGGDAEGESILTSSILLQLRRTKLR